MKRIFSYIFAGIIILGLGYFYGLPIIKQKIGEWEVKNLAEALKKAEEDDYKLALADTYGGKTPQETLNMFIEAVEKGDYELASKYMIIPKQEEEFKNLSHPETQKNLKSFLDILKQAKFDNFSSSSDDQSFFSEIKFDSGPSMYIKFWRYPSGNWKIHDF